MRTMKNPCGWLKALTILAAVAGGLFAFRLIPAALVNWEQTHPEAYGVVTPGLIVTWTAAALCYLVLWEFWKMAVRIGRDQSFCRENVVSLKRMSLLMWLLAGICAALAAAMKWFDLGQWGPMVLALLVMCACAALGVLASALAALVQKAAALKEQADLTI